MTNNDVLRRLRYVFDYDDEKMIELFTLAGATVSRSEVSDWLKKDDDAAQKVLEDVSLATFLNGLIVEKRGRRDGPQPEPETSMNNNIIFRKLKIALDLKAEDILALLANVDFRLSKHELSAFFRKEGHKHYRACNNQILRNFLNAMQQRERPGTAWESSPSET